MIKVWGAILHGLKFCSTGFGVNSMQCRVWGWGSMAQQLHTITACVQGWQFQSICMPTLQWLGWHCERFWGVLYWVWGSILHDLNFYSARVGNAVFCTELGILFCGVKDSGLTPVSVSIPHGLGSHSGGFGDLICMGRVSILQVMAFIPKALGFHFAGPGVPFCKVSRSIGHQITAKCGVTKCPVLAAGKTPE